MKTRKSSLSLSVNAIVVLIIAITMLGLALGFVRMLFGGATQKFTGLLAEEQEPAIPTTASPVTLSRGMVIANPGKDQAIKVSLYNPTDSTWNAVTPAITCTPTAFSSAINTKKILQGKYVTFGALITIPSNEPEGTHLCEVTFSDATAGTLDYSIDFTIQVQHG